jgi:hypothetical protein
MLGWSSYFVIQFYLQSVLVPSANCVKTCIQWHVIEVDLRPTVSRPGCPGVRHPSGTRDQFFFLLEISFRQLRLCYFVAPSLTRGRVRNLLVQLLLGLARAVTLGSKSRRTHGHSLLSHLRLPQPGGPGSRIYIAQEQGGPVILLCRRVLSSAPL